MIRARMMPPSRRIGLALGPDCLTAVVPPAGSNGDAGSEIRDRALQLAGAPGEWPDLGAAVRELADVSLIARARVSIALLPGLVHVKTIRVPGLSNEDLRRVVARDCARYFVGAREPHVAAVQRPGGRRARRGAALVAAAPEWVIEAIERAVHAVGWTLDRIVPAHVAWAHATEEAGAERGKVQTRIVVVPMTTGIELLRVYRDVVAEGRRVPPAAGSAVIAARIDIVRGEIATGDTPGVTILADTVPLDSVIAAVRDTGYRIAAGPAPSTSDGQPLPPLTLGVAGTSAARCAGQCRALILVPDRTREHHRSVARRTAFAVWAIAAASIVLTAGLRLWDIRRELAAVEQRRSGLHARVSRVMRARASVDSVRKRLDAFATLEHDSRAWSSVVATIAEHLPSDAHLLAFRARPDSVVLEGVAQRAATVFEAMQQAPGVRGVRSSAPIRQELDEQQRPTERFTLALTMPTAPAPTEATRPVSPTPGAR